MNLLVHLTQRPSRLDLTGVDALSRLTSAVHGAGHRRGVGVGLRLALRLDTDPRTEPFTTQQRRSVHPTGSREVSRQTLILGSSP